MRNSIGYYAGFCVLLAFAGAIALAVVHVLKVAKKVRTLISDPFDVEPAERMDLDPVDAQLDSNPRELTLDEVADLIRSATPADGYKERIRRHIAREHRAAEDSPLLREIYAAQSLYRDGVDVTRNAPEERV